jgi:predicted GNAT family N-acyltransferase
LQDYPEQTITVNSSPYGVPFYHALGFEDSDKEQTVNGIRFTPMKYEGLAEVEG